MIGFRDFIAEAGDTFHPYTKRDNDSVNRHFYEFRDGSGNKKVVEIYHHRDSADVVFYDYDNREADSKEKYGASGHLGHRALKTFSTIKHILRRHATNHPHIKSYEFTSNIDEPSRASLYKRITHSLGGTTEKGQYRQYHMIPSERLIQSK